MTRSNPEYQMFIGLSFICLATLSFHGAIRSLPGVTKHSCNFDSPDPTTRVLNSLAVNTGSLNAIEAAIVKLSQLLDELQDTVSATCSNCLPLDRDELCGRRSEDDWKESPLLVVGVLGFWAWVFGMGVFLDGLRKISPGFMQRVLVFGLVAANITVAFMIFWMDSLPWYNYVVYTMWSSYAGMMAGTFPSRAENGELRKKGEDNSKEIPKTQQSP